jgi:serine/threonine-protein kinase
VQDDIAANVASLLHASLSGGEAMRGGGQRRIAPQAYEHKLRGQHLFSRRSEGDLEAAVRQFEAAVALEPDYAEAWVGLAGALWVLMAKDGVLAEDEVAAFREAALRGAELGPGLPEAHLRVMQVYRSAGDVAAAERHFRIARELGPENSLVLGMTAGQALSDGRLDKAIDYLLRALHGDPLSLTIRHNVAFVLLAAGRTEEARRQVDIMNDIGQRNKASTTALELSLLLRENRHAEALAIAESESGGGYSPTREEWIARTAMALHAVGRQEEALEAGEALVAAGSYKAAYALAEFHAWRGDADAALEWLGEARARHALVPPVLSMPTWLQLVTLSPFFDPLRTDSRFGDVAGISQ